MPAKQDCMGLSKYGPQGVGGGGLTWNHTGLDTQTFTAAGQLEDLEDISWRNDLIPGKHIIFIFIFSIFKYYGGRNWQSFAFFFFLICFIVQVSWFRARTLNCT